MLPYQWNHAKERRSEHWFVLKRPARHHRLEKKECAADVKVPDIERELNSGVQLFFSYLLPDWCHAIAESLKLIIKFNNTYHYGQPSWLKSLETRVLAHRYINALQRKIYTRSKNLFLQPVVRVPGRKVELWTINCTENSINSKGGANDKHFSKPTSNPYTSK